MKKLGRTSSTFTTVVAGAAVLAVFGTGTAVAGGLITSAKIKNNTIKSIDVRNNNLKSVDILDNSLTGGDVADFSLSNEDAGVLFAQVNANGTVANSSGGVTATRIEEGIFRVTFAHNVSQCAFTTGLGSSTTGDTTGQASAVDSLASVNAVTVKTYNDAAVPAPLDKAFQLIVVC